RILKDAFRQTSETSNLSLACKLFKHHVRQSPTPRAYLFDLIFTGSFFVQSPIGTYEETTCRREATIWNRCGDKTPLSNVGYTNRYFVIGTPLGPRCPRWTASLLSKLVES